MDTQKIDVLLVEDNPGDVFLVREALQSHDLAINLRVVGDGKQALDLLERCEHDQTSPCPGLLLLDLNLPRLSGHEILERVRPGSRLASMPIIIISSTC